MANLFNEDFEDFMNCVNKNHSCLP